MNYPHIYKCFNNMSFISENEWIFFESLLIKYRFKKGEHLIKAGDDSDSMFIIISGLARVFYIDNHGSEFNKIFLTQNEVSSAYTEYLQKMPSRIFVEALENTIALKLPLSQLEKLYQRDHHWSELGRKIIEQFFIVKEQREFEFLMMDAKDRYLKFLNDYHHIHQRIAQYHVAAYLGITPVSLSRIIKSLK